MRKVLAALVLIAPSVFGCTCGPPSHPFENIVSPVETTLDFGEVFLGQKPEKSVVFTLDGRTSSSLSLVPGSVPADFAIDLPDGASLSPGQKLKVTVSLSPTEPGPHQGDIVIRATNTQTGQVTLHVAGVGVRPAIQCDPAELDFGTVLIGTKRTLPKVITNLVDSNLHVDLSSDDPAFTIDPPSVDLGPLGASTVEVTFTPTSRGSFDGPHLRMNICPTCAVVTEQVKGVGAVEQFSLTPSPLDFGTHSPGSTTCIDEVIKNTGDVPIRFDLAKPDPAFHAAKAFDLDIGSLLDGTTTLDPKATASVRICFKPTALATIYSGGIDFRTVTNDFASLKVVGRGGSAQIVCVPNPIDFGVTTPSAPVTRQLVCKNLGQPEDVLLKTISVDHPDTLRVDYSQDGDPTGFNVGRADFHLGVTLAASIPGDYADKITVTFAKPGAPEDDQIQVLTSGTIVDGVPCSLSVRPAEVRFGFVRYQQTYTREVTIVNTSPTSACTVWGFGLDPTRSDLFALSGAPEGISSIAPGASLVLTVSYAPIEASIDPDLQTLTFKQVTASGVDPTVTVPISGFASQLCLAVEPSPLDFGTIPIPYVKHLAVNVTNCGARQVRIGGNVPLPNPAGDVAPSSDSPPVVTVENVPRLPYSLSPGLVMTFIASFAPTSPGDYRGELEIWLQNTPEPIIVPWLGTATNDPCGELCGKPTAACPAIQKTWVGAAVTLKGAGFDQKDPASVTCHWDVLQAPPLSTALPEDPDQCVTNFRPDVDGQYTFQLTVKNSQGYTDTCKTEIQAKTFLGLWIETTWSAPDDIDLHLFHPLAGDPLNASTWFSLPYDCYYSNQNPYWDTASRADDPSLDRDDEVDMGPENIRIDSPSTQHDYEIGVHWFASRNRNHSQTVTTRVFCAGKQMAELSNVLTRQYMAADVGTVRWHPDNTCDVSKGRNFTLTVIP